MGSQKTTRQILDQQSIDRLIESAAQGDEVAITRLLWAHYDQLANYVTPLIPTSLQSLIDAEDLLQDTFTVAWRKIPTLDFPDELTLHAWLRTVLRRKLLDRVRAANRQKRGGQHSCRTTHALLELLAAEARSPSSIVAGDEAEYKLRIAIVELPKRQRSVLELRFLQALSVPEVAKRMKCSSGAVHMLTGRAVRNLRTLMGNESRFFSVK